MPFFEVSHRGVHEVERVEAATPEIAVACFRQRHGQIQSVHTYQVTELKGDAALAEPTMFLPRHPAPQPAEDTENLKRCEVNATVDLDNLDIRLPAEHSAPIASDAPSDSVPVPATEPVAELPVAATHDPTLEEMGIVGETADLLTEAGLTTRSQIIAFASENDGLTVVNGIGEVTEGRIREAVAEFG